jgi:hypothetical protein
MDQPKLVDCARVYGAMPAVVLPLLQDSARHFATVAQRASVESPDHAVSGSEILGDALDGQKKFHCNRVGIDYLSILHEKAASGAAV